MPMSLYVNTMVDTNSKATGKKGHKESAIGLGEQNGNEVAATGGGAQTDKTEILPHEVEVANLKSGSSDLMDALKRLDEINAAITRYDPAMKEKATEILFEKAFGGGPRRVVSSGAQKISPQETNADVANKPDFATLVEKWTPVTSVEWALLATYYLNKVLGMESVSGFAVNKVLKDHGNSAPNITLALSGNMDARPQRILQVGKSGSSRQARKEYKITTSGIQFVEQKLQLSQSGTQGEPT